MKACFPFMFGDQSRRKAKPETPLRRQKSALSPWTLLSITTKTCRCYCLEKAVSKKKTKKWWKRDSFLGCHSVVGEQRLFQRTERRSGAGCAGCGLLLSETLVANRLHRDGRSILILVIGIYQSESTEIRVGSMRATSPVGLHINPPATFLFISKRNSHFGLFDTSLEFVGFTHLNHFILMTQWPNVRFYVPFSIFSPPRQVSWGMWSDGPICEIRWEGVCFSKRSWQAHQSEPVSDMFGTTREPVSAGFHLGTKQEASGGKNSTKLIKAAVRLALFLSLAVRLLPFMWDCSSFSASPRPCVPRAAPIRGGILGRSPRVLRAAAS